MTKMAVVAVPLSLRIVGGKPRGLNIKQQQGNQLLTSVFLVFQNTLTSATTCVLYKLPVEQKPLGRSSVV